MKNKYLLILLLFLIASTGDAQTKSNSELFNELKSSDSLIFERAFNNCDFSSIESVLYDDFEFYHDQNGVMENKEAFITIMKQGICSSWERKPIRKIVEGTIKVFPLYERGLLYGAIQSGEHEFFIKEEGMEMYKTNIAQFTHLWIKTKDGWQLKRVLSYDHQDPTK